MNITSVDTKAIETKPRQASIWPRYPALYEINTWIWLAELSRKHARRIDLSAVPASEWDAIAAFGFDAVWFMGVWERSPAGIAIANRNPGLREDFYRALPDFRPEDNVGSPYCVRRYVVDPHLGGPEGLAVARRELSKRGMNLLLDLVPNHVAPDHPWVVEHPEYFVHGSADELKSSPSAYLEIGGQIFANGRDPYFPAWPDVLQLNAFAPGLRRAVIETVLSIAAQCDGIRCDMAMLFLNSIFERTWGGRAGLRPATEYWVDVISAAKSRHPNFLFIAEAYWDLEWELQQLGFDFCYDKKLYDRLEHGNVESIRLHLCADLSYQSKLVRFIENHDEPRAAATFSPAKERVAALAVATLPGTKLFHEGQLEGRKVRPPVFLARRPDEPVDHELLGFYAALLRAIDRPIFREGSWALCERTGWPDNPTFENLVAWSWQRDDKHIQRDERNRDKNNGGKNNNNKDKNGGGQHACYLIVVNLSDRASQARVQLPWAGTDGAWLLTDQFSGATYERDANEMRSSGLYVELAPLSYHFFRALRKNQ